MLLRSKRLNISHYTEHDLDAFNTILMNDTIMKGIRGEGYSADTSRAKFEEALRVNKRYSDLGFFNVTHKATDELVGFAKLVLMDDGNLEVGYALLEKLWGFGFASEITAALTEHALKTYPKKEIIGIVNIENEPSAHVLRKQHFELKSTSKSDGYDIAYYYYSK